MIHCVCMMCDWCAYSMAGIATLLKAWHFHLTRLKLPLDSRIILCLSTRLEKTGMLTTVFLYFLCIQIVYSVICLKAFNFAR